MATLSPTELTQHESLPVSTSRAKSCGVTIVLISTDHDRVTIESQLVITSRVESSRVPIVLVSMNHDLVMIQSYQVIPSHLESVSRYIYFLIVPLSRQTPKYSSI